MKKSKVPYIEQKTQGGSDGHPNDRHLPYLGALIPQ